jgi:cytochrome c biogenesis protein CcdA/thiol-disulfide isomerase/thioredoxin
MLYVVAWLGGILTIVSPCILPVLPFVLTRTGLPFRRSGLPLLLGMALTFTTLSMFAAVAGHWVVRANQAGRVLAMTVFALFGLTLVFQRFSDKLFQPLVRLGAHAGRFGPSEESSAGHWPIGRAMLLGASTGMLWAPCAGPILGLILTGAALSGATWHSAGLLASFATGAAFALSLVMFGGKRLIRFARPSLQGEEWVRRGIGIVVLASVAAIALGLDTGVLTRISLARTSRFEQRLVDGVRPARPAPTINEGPMPNLVGASSWLNSPPLDATDFRGRVLLVDFWTYSCINCLRSIPYVRAWFDEYRDRGFIVVGVHTPEFAFEKDIANVRQAVHDLNITYPVAIDNRYAIWKAFANEYWPAHYLIDADGIVRYHHFGEGQYEETEKVIQQLLKEQGATPSDARSALLVNATGAQAAPSMPDVKSPETYLGYERQDNFSSPQPVRKNEPARYTAPLAPMLNQWGLAGQWNVRSEDALLLSSPGAIRFRFHARDLHLVLGSVSGGRPVRFRVLLDDTAPLDDRGVDVNPDGTGMVTGHRLYQLVRQKGPIVDRTFEIQFLDPGVEAFAFTFG